MLKEFNERRKGRNRLQGEILEELKKKQETERRKNRREALDMIDNDALLLEAGAQNMRKIIDDKEMLQKHEILIEHYLRLLEPESSARKKWLWLRNILRDFEKMSVGRGSDGKVEDCLINEFRY